MGAAGVVSVVAISSAAGSAQAFCVGWDKTLPDYDPAYYSVSHEFRRSKYVVEAQVLRETWLGEDGKPRALQPPFQNGASRPWGFDPYLGAYYDVQVIKAYKPRGPAVLRLFSDNSTARFWLKPGGRYVLFVSEDTFDAPVGKSLTVDHCGNSAPLSRAGKALRRMAKLSPPR